MKFAVYCITKNEELFVDRMMESVIDDADEIVIVDTGSTDKTVELIEKWQSVFPKKIKLFHMTIKPWRFDVARNVSLAHVSPDIDVCLQLDLDEIMLPGWRREIEKVWIPGETTRCSYEYVWSLKPDGSPDVSFSTDKLHSRFGYDWYHPIHETLRYYDFTIRDGALVLKEEKRAKSHAVMHHHPDPTKSRGQYLPLLELSVREAPWDDRNSYYLGREYYFYAKVNAPGNEFWQKAIDQLAAYRNLHTAIWNAERASSWRISGLCLTALGRQDEALACYRMATQECPEMRENWLELARAFYNRADWPACLDASSRAVAITEVPDVYITDRNAYNEEAHDLMSIAAWNLGQVDVATEQCRIAISINPNDPRLQTNLAFMAAKAA